MRRKDREMTDVNKVIDVVRLCKVCRLAMANDGQPYIVPLNYGCVYENGILSLYFHSGKGGKKLEILAQNHRVCFEMDCDLALREAQEPCDYGYYYTSVIGFGKAQLIEDPGEKAAGLNAIMKHQTSSDKIYDFSEQQLNSVAIIKVTADSFTGKQKVK